MWEAINGAWLELKRFERLRDEPARSSPASSSGRKGVSLAFDGSAYRTMLRNDAFWFTRLGTGDRARRQHRPHPRRQVPHAAARDRERRRLASIISSGPTILREVSALTAYHWVYRESVKPWLVADLLILNRQMPRSLANCCEILVRHLDLIADAYGLRGESQRLASNMLARLSATTIDDVIRAKGCTSSSKSSSPKTTGSARPSPSSICCSPPCASASPTKPRTATSGRSSRSSSCFASRRATTTASTCALAHRASRHGRLKPREDALGNLVHVFSFEAAAVEELTHPGHGRGRDKRRERLRARPSSACRRSSILRDTDLTQADAAIRAFARDVAGDSPPTRSRPCTASSPACTERWPSTSNRRRRRRRRPKPSRSGAASARI